MNRRRALLTLGAVSLAGCLDSEDGADELRSGRPEEPGDPDRPVSGFVTIHNDGTAAVVVVVDAADNADYLVVTEDELDPPLVADPVLATEDAEYTLADDPEADIPVSPGRYALWLVVGFHRGGGLERAGGILQVGLVEVTG